VAAVQHGRDQETNDELRRGDGVNIAIIHRDTSGEPSVLITDQGDRHLLGRLRELTVEPDADAPVPVTLSTGGIWQIDGDSILDAFEVPDGTNACDVKAEYVERQAAA
jgi:hypothetical protein